MKSELKTEFPTSLNLVRGLAGRAGPAVPRMCVLAALVGALALGAEAGGSEGEIDCKALATTDRTLESSPAEISADSILAACATTEIKLLRATTLDGVPVLELPLPALPGEGEAP